MFTAVYVEKTLKKYGRSYFACIIFLIHSVSPNVANFPAKRQYGAQNTHAPIFFLNTLLINWTFTVVFLYTGTLVNKVKWQVCLISFLLSFNKQQKFYIQSILFVLSSLQPQVNWLSTFRLIYEKVSTKIDVIYTKTFGGKIWTNLHRVFPCNFFWQKFEQRFLKKCPPKNN